MRRRGGGVGAINKKRLAEAKFKDKGTSIAEDQLAQMSKQLEAFRTYLEDFATKHKNDIRKSPEFRTQFQEMCATIGVDPLASGKGFWSEMLGVGEFYYELGVQIIEVCLATQHRNGGLMYLNELLLKVRTTRGKSKQAQDVSADDLMRAIKKLKILGNGFTLLKVGDGNNYLVQSVPAELNMDHTSVLQAAKDTGNTSIPQLKQKLEWEEERAKLAVDYMVKEGLAWVDMQTRPQLYWFPGLFTETS
ncbi:vacuolar-sorting protein SNF8-like [Saccoglossus kowalevskii]|uniref:Vacuolar-sorting protein SNF8 n=1 Tax=Saccoglossus kowalevskii TaxID=10224 RepID=A0ABM0H1F0_SACKO|nr:PREDICTED: vacuolar-sorting protein SNF8-like [Saccoglossus kowalevskii]